MTKNQSSNKSLIYLGTESLGKPVFRYLANNFNLKLAITTPAKKAGRGQKRKASSPIMELAKKLDVPSNAPDKLTEKAIKEINELEADFILVFAYGKIIPVKKIDCKKILNIHPSLLPKLRGPSPIRSAILKGLDKTGVTLMKMDEKIDHGPIIAQEAINIEEKETYPTLKKKVKRTSLNLIKKHLPLYLKGEIEPTAQDHSKATFSKMIKKKDGKINWEEPAYKIERKIRALNPKPGTYTKVDGEILKIHSAKVVGDKLKLGEVQLEGRKKMDFEDFKNGWKKELDFSEKIA